MAQHIEAFRVGFHQAVFDPVMHHFDEMARTRRAAMQITAFSRSARRASFRGRNSGHTGRQRGKDRIEIFNRPLLAADHQAVTAFEAPHPATGPDIDEMDTFAAQDFRPADIIAVEGISSVDDDVTLLQQAG